MWVFKTQYDTGSFLACLAKRKKKMSLSNNYDNVQLGGVACKETEPLSWLWSPSTGCPSIWLWPHLASEDGLLLSAHSSHFGEDLESQSNRSFWTTRGSRTPKASRLMLTSLMAKLRAGKDLGKSPKHHLTDGELRPAEMK